MSPRKNSWAVLALLAGLFLSTNAASAQGLIWKLPPEGTWVEFAGTYSQTDFRPESARGDLKPQPWQRLLRISALGGEEAEYNGQQVPCRWIELEVVTGRLDAGVIDPGPAGSRIYKVLVPEHKIIGETADSDGIPVSIIPIVRGYRKIGEGEVKPLAPAEGESGVLQVFPVISLLSHYRNLQAVSGQPENAEVDLGENVTAVRYHADFRMESSVARSIHSADLWRSEQMPFGLARWEVSISREEKGRTEPRDAFEKASEFTVQMKARAVGADARSKIAEQ